MNLPAKILLYADVNLELIDGSSIWVQSLVSTLLESPRNHITVVTRKPDARGIVTKSVRGDERVRFVDSSAHESPNELSQVEAFESISALDDQENFDILIVRGNDVAQMCASSGQFEGRIWLYYLPPKDGAFSQSEQELLRTLAPHCRHILCQTEAVRSYVEALVPQWAGLMLTLPPMIPSPDVDQREQRESPVVVLYTGKLAPEYRFLDMVDTVRELSRRGIDATFLVAGDKIHNPKDDPGFMPEVRRVLAEEPFVEYVGGVDRDSLIRLASKATVALSLRTEELDRSLELSTKLLEYGSVGLPVVLNRNAAHEELLGSDYPLFAFSPSEAADVILRLVHDPDLRTLASECTRRAAEGHTFERVWEHISPYISLASPLRRYQYTGGRSLRVLVAGSDLKFFREIQHHFEDAGAEILLDEWAGAEKHVPAHSYAMLRKADVIVCEWCTGNAVWYSRRKRDHQKLIVRLHRWEAETEYPSQVNFEAVDHAIFVAPHIRDRVLADTGWPIHKTTILNNWVDIRAFRRAKLPAADFTLGMLGWVDSRKRLDRALDLISAVRQEDPRFRAILKGRMPWELDWVWNRSGEQEYFIEQLHRIDDEPALQGAVSFEPFGPDTSSWFRQIGFLLSTSDDEGNQVSVTEAIAARTVPVILERPGAYDTYPAEWVHASHELAAEAVLAGYASHRELLDRGQKILEEDYDPWMVASRWDDLVLGAE